MLNAELCEIDKVVHVVEGYRMSNQMTFQVLLGTLMGVITCRTGQWFSPFQGPSSHFQILIRFLEPASFRFYRAHTELLPHPISY